MIRQHDIVHAREQVDVLRQQQPDDVDVIKLQLQLLDPQTQKDKVRALVQRMPETTKEQTLDKINTAMAVKQQDIALRLLEAVLAKYPNDDAVLRTAFKIYQATGAKEKMVAIADRAHALHPDNPDLSVVASVLSNPTTLPVDQVRQKLREGLLAKTTDPFRREVLLASFAREDGKSDEQLQHLKAAEKLKPDDLDVKVQLFGLYLERKEFGHAERYIEPLAKANKDQVNGLMFKFRLAMAKGDINAAVDDARQITQAMPEFGQSWLALGQALQAAQQYDEALSRFQTALEKQPDNGSAYRGAIECEYALGRKDDAKRLITQARTVLPNDQQFVEMELNYELTYGDPESVIPARGGVQEAAGQSFSAAHGRTHLSGCGPGGFIRIQMTRAMPMPISSRQKSCSSRGSPNGLMSPPSTPMRLNPQPRPRTLPAPRSCSRISPPVMPGRTAPSR